MTAVEAALRELVALGATGALHVDASLGAVLYLQEGRVTHIDADAAPGIGTVLTASGRLSKDVWESVRTVGGPSARVGALLVDQGYLSQGELELCVNSALFDAAYFALEAEPTAVRFVAGEASWFGGTPRVDVERVVREVARRRDQLTATFPSSEFDEAPLALVPRLPRDQIVVDGLRWELLLNADGRRTPLELARQLGRGAFATLLEVRRLAAIGALRAPSATGAAGRPAVTPYRPAIGAPAAAKTKPTTDQPGPLNGKAPASHGPVGTPSAAGEGLSPLPPLPQRVGRAGRVVRPSQQGRGAEEPSGPSAGRGEMAAPRWASPPPEIHADPPTVSSLRRVRDALQDFS
ncbi:DUF4388 domain-containing protein [Cryptosporangium minutisporangium]|uniref:PatA-like N-terminal domain-containing protein n=1 Tax=Cryptosporangium minutisporangium TaxID=113569 RepID=A0ABP6T8V3_9ACTN